MKRNLSILISSLSGGGAQRVVSVLLYELKNDYNITLVLMNDKIEYDIPKDIGIVYLENYSEDESNLKKTLKLPILGWKYKKICQERKIHSSLSFLYRPNFINVFAKLFGLESKVIISERSTPSETYYGKSLSSRLGRFLVSFLYQKADVVVPNSQGSAIDLIENFSVARVKIKVVQNPFNIEKIVSESLESISFLRKEGFVFLTVGRLENIKNHDLIIKSFSKLEGENLQLWILGQGPLEQELKDLVNQLQLNDRVKFFGFDRNPYKYMKRADCLALASTREGFPNVLVESLACGLPIISSDCPNGPREIIAPKTDVKKKLNNEIEIAEYGILTPIDNESFFCEAMELIIKDKAMYNSYRSSIKIRANDFSKHFIIKKFEEVL